MKEWKYYVTVKTGIRSSLRWHLHYNADVQKEELGRASEMNGLQ